MLLVLAVGLAVIVGSSPAQAQTAAVLPAPGCPGANPDFPEIDLCEDNGSYELSSTGSLTGGANITMSTSVPPCSSQDTVTDIFEPDGCYSAVEFEIDPFNCTGIDIYDPDEPYFGACGFYEDGRNPGFYSGLQGDHCSHAFDLLFVNGGNWSDRGPQALSSCVFTMDGDPFDGLYGPAWMEVDSELQIEYSDGTFESVHDVGYVSMEGEIRDVPPQAAFDRSAGAEVGRYHFADESRAQFGDPLSSYEWEFQKIEVGVDEEWVTVGTATGRFPSFTFADADYANVGLTVTDQNGLEDTYSRVWQLFLDDWDPGGGDVPIVTVEATDAQADEEGPDTGTWTVTRSESVGELTVDVSQSGSATEGVDYEAVDDEVTFADGVDEVPVTLTPLDDDDAEDDEVVTYTVEEGTGYAPGDPSTADITIADDDGPTFLDVGLTHTFFDDIEWMAEQGISEGYLPGPTYRPSVAVSRQAMSAFMYRLAGEPELPPLGEGSFRDVSVTHPFFEEIEWMAAEGISEGYADGTYRPSSAVSRMAMSAFMYRLAGEPPFTLPDTPTFIDVSFSHPFASDIEWMAEAEISEGYLPGPEFRPSSAVSRQAMSAFMHRLADGPGVEAAALHDPSVPREKPSPIPHSTTSATAAPNRDKVG
jgi:hypothetical protein